MTKFTRPALPHALIRRPELLSRLDSAMQLPCTLVAGSPGVGKTVLLSSWVQERTQADAPGSRAIGGIMTSSGSGRPLRLRSPLSSQVAPPMRSTCWPRVQTTSEMSWPRWSTRWLCGLAPRGSSSMTCTKSLPPISEGSSLLSNDFLRLRMSCSGPVSIPFCRSNGGGPGGNWLRSGTLTSAWKKSTSTPSCTSTASTFPAATCIPWPQGPKDGWPESSWQRFHFSTTPTTPPRLSDASMEQSTW